MTESIYKEYQNKYYNPDDSGKEPGDNENWQSVQEGFYRIGTTQLETSEGLTLGKGTADEVSVTPAELAEMKEGGGRVKTIVTRHYKYDEGDLHLTKIDYDYPININTVNTYDVEVAHTYDYEELPETRISQVVQVVIFDNHKTINGRIYMPGVEYHNEPTVTSDIEVVGVVLNLYVTTSGYLVEFASL